MPASEKPTQYNKLPRDPATGAAALPPKAAATFVPRRGRESDICGAAFIGRIERGFDFLSYHFSRAGLTVAKQTIANFIEKASWLYHCVRAKTKKDE